MPQHAAKQLSPELRALLLQDLVKHNGLNFCDVPVQTFSKKFIGLYFADLSNPRCKSFQSLLRAFCATKSEKLECFLVSCDAREEDFIEHASQTLWPTYSWGDYRASLLRNQLGILDLPSLVLLDPNMIVVTTAAVERLEADEGHLFPWIEPAIEAVYGEVVQGSLLHLLEDLNLPLPKGTKLSELVVIGLLIGELWCPSTRELLERLRFLHEHLLHRLQDGNSKERIEPTWAFYHVVADDTAARFPNLLDYTPPFPVLRIEDQNKREMLRTFFSSGSETDAEPVFYLASVPEGWKLPSAATSLQADPVGICFPWRPPHTCDENLQVDVVRPLCDVDLSMALCEGPIFIAFLHEVHAQRAECLATLRAAASKFIGECCQLERDSGQLEETEQVEDGTGNAPFPGSNAHSNGIGKSLADEVQLPRTLSEDEGADAITRLRTALAMPSRPEGLRVPKPYSTGRRDREERVLYKVIQKEQQAEQAEAASGGASSICAGLAGLQSRRSSTGSQRSSSESMEAVRHTNLRFFYTSSQDEATALLDQFCSSDTKQLKSHQKWREFQLQNNEEGSLNAELMGRHGTAFVPTPGYPPVNEATMGQVDAYQRQGGTGILINCATGSYYVCGNLSDKSVLLDFLKSWQSGKLDSFDIRLTNAAEHLGDDDPNLLLENTTIPEEQSPKVRVAEIKMRDFTVMPCVVIWMPTEQHEDCGFTPSGLYRALLEFAFQQCPMQSGYDARGLPLSDLRETTQGATRFIPWVAKLWIFALLKDERQQTADATEDTPTHYGSASQEFLAELHEYVDLMCRKAVEFKRSSSMTLTKKTSRNSSAASLHSARSRAHRHIARRHPEEQFHFGPHKEEMLIENTELFDEGLRSLRTSDTPYTCTGNYNLCMRTARTRRELHALMMEELVYHGLLQHPVPPLFVLFAGDLLPPEALPWPSMLEQTHMYVLGRVPNLAGYRKVSPGLCNMDWSVWSKQYATDRVSGVAARHMTVPWQ